jgi:hypothetical protein
LEVFLRRQPDDAEFRVLQQQVEQICRSQGGTPTVELAAGLGTLYLNQHEPGLMVLDDHGEPHVPRIGTMGVVAVGGLPARSVAVRIAFSDDRADEFLRKEAKQLPKDAPGIVMIDVSDASGGMRTWRPLLEKRLQPNMHTRVSAICLFASLSYPSDAGESWRMETKLLLNKNAAMQLSSSLISILSRYESDDPDISSAPRA